MNVRNPLEADEQNRSGYEVGRKVGEDDQKPTD